MKKGILRVPRCWGKRRFAWWAFLGWSFHDRESVVVQVWHPCVELRSASALCSEKNRTRIRRMNLAFEKAELMFHQVDSFVLKRAFCQNEKTFHFSPRMNYSKAIFHILRDVLWCNHCICIFMRIYFSHLRARICTQDHRSSRWDIIIVIVKIADGQPPLWMKWAQKIIN